MEKDILRTSCCKNCEVYIKYRVYRNYKFKQELDEYIRTTVNEEFDLDEFEDTFYFYHTFYHTDCVSDCQHDISNCQECKKFLKLKEQ